MHRPASHERNQPNDASGGGPQEVDVDAVIEKALSGSTSSSKQKAPPLLDVDVELGKEEAEIEIVVETASHSNSDKQSNHVNFDPPTPQPIASSHVPQTPSCKTNNAAYTPLSASERSSASQSSRSPAMATNHNLPRRSYTTPVGFKTVELPKDVYSIGYLAPRFSGPFWYALVVFGIQASILWLTFLDLTQDHPKFVDANFWNVPPQVSTEVFVAQYLALLVAVLSQDDVTTSLVFFSVGVGPRYPQVQAQLQTKYPGKGSATFARYWTFNLLRFTEGLVTILVSFVFIIQSDNVLDIFLNFAAVQFVADLDNLGFRLAVEGWFGVANQSLAKRILQEKIPLRRTKGYIDYMNQILLFLLVAVLFCMNAVTVRQLKTGDYIERDACGVVLVQFGGPEVYVFPRNATFQTGPTGSSATEEGLQQLANSERWIQNHNNNNNLRPPDLHFASFSGRYVAEFNYKAGLNRKRPVYYEASREGAIVVEGLSTTTTGSRMKDSSTAMLYFCETENAWVWTVRAFAQATGADIVPPATLQRCPPYGWLARSPITDAVTLDEAPTEGWKVWTGTLQDLTELSIACLECEEDADCGLTGGTCGGKEDRLCECHKGQTAGDFCTERYPCQQLIRYGDDDGQQHGIFELEASFSYGRPVYSSMIAGNMEDPKEEGSVEVVQYTGRQWTKYQQPYYYSEPTDQFLPTGSLRWYKVDETRSQGDYGPKGREIPVSHRYSCWSLDCNVASAGLCGQYGTCVQEQVLTFRGEPHRNNVRGGKCICDKGYEGHFCEFKQQHSEDDGEL
ncbi:expressed unknown protein [Seminavis robusta]|uniref:EGF-like domain-containing protein n=1 Tax=Seminavis robusta TaxID=568900 RepID=A0A9N8D6Q7_9STRA|nr:expressed unknown protein [Seminavis robusta]|eukprot:Sro20_g013820.1 n/a (793) ;mRNA; r:8123-10612